MHQAQKLLSSPLPKIVFWGYNFAYLLFLLLLLLTIGFSRQFTGSNPPSLIELLTFGGNLPLGVLLTTYALILTPIISMVLASRPKISAHPGNLTKFFFGFQIPLLFLLITRIFFLRQMTLPTNLLLGAFALAVIGLLIHMFRPQNNSKSLLAFLLTTQQIAFLISAYAFLLSFFFLPIIIAFFLNNITSTNFDNFLTMLLVMLNRGEILFFLLMLLGLAIFFLTAAFFTIGAVGAAGTFYFSSKTLYHELKQHYGLKFARIARYGISTVFALLVIIFSIQPTYQSDKVLLGQFQSAQTFEQAQEIGKEIVRRDKQIRNNLVDSYLAPYRYLSDQNMNILTQGYTNELKLPQTGKTIQRLFNHLALPLIYQGHFERDIEAAVKNYQAVFDDSIQKGELATISKTLKETNTQDSFKAGILDLKEETVHLEQRTVKVTSNPDGLSATVTVEEEYKNVSKEPQEVYYEFSLPQNSVITDLKLGPDLEIGANALDRPLPSQNAQQTASPPPVPGQRVDTGVVAPEGAATAVYEDQVFIRRTDPALLSQVGPRQYKLRIYPIPPEGQTLDGVFTSLPQKNQKMRFSYLTLLDKGTYHLPTISEQRNVFIDNNTKTSESFNGKVGLPQSLPCPNATVAASTSVGNVVFIPSRNFCALNPTIALNAFVGKRLAILADSSYSSRNVSWSTYLKNNLPDELIASGNVDLFFFNDKLSAPMRLTSHLLQEDKGLDPVKIGKTDRLSALSKISTSYALVIMLTDDGVFDSSSNSTISSFAPFYLVHPEGKIPPYNRSLTNAIIQSGGATVTSVQDALAHYSQGHSSDNQLGGSVLELSPSGTWLLASPNSPLEKLPTSQSISSLAYKILILSQIRAAGTNLENLETLDKIHQLSQAQTIVTPYSSMIVLVTEAQREQLAQASAQNNRFQANFDIGEESPGNPAGTSMLQIGAVPEPHEWLLIFIAAILLFFFNRKRVLLLLRR